MWYLVTFGDKSFYLNKFSLKWWLISIQFYLLQWTNFKILKSLILRLLILKMNLNERSENYITDCICICWRWIADTNRCAARISAGTDTVSSVYYIYIFYANTFYLQFLLIFGYAESVKSEEILYLCFITTYKPVLRDSHFRRYFILKFKSCVSCLPFHHREYYSSRFNLLPMSPLYRKSCLVSSNLFQPLSCPRK